MLSPLWLLSDKHLYSQYEQEQNDNDLMTNQISFNLLPPNQKYLT